VVDPDLGPLHSSTRPNTAWSRGNVGEAMPGVFTPLGWSVTGPAVELGVRRGFHALGVLRRDEVRFSAVADENSWGVFFGQAAMNLDVFRYFADRMPGASGSKIEQQILGTARPGVVDHPVRRRYPLIAVKMPLAVMLVRRRLIRLRRRTREWWREMRDALPEASKEQALDALRESGERFAQAMALHSVTSMIASGVFERLKAVVERTDADVTIADLVTGYGSMEETGIADKLWRVAHGESSIEEFLDEFGFHGPTTGQIATKVWREDPTLLAPTLARLKGLEPEEAPQRREWRQVQVRHAAERRLLTGLSLPQRPLTWILLRLAPVFITGREIGKSGYLQTLDVARLAGRRLGQILVAQGVLEHPGDVFFLVERELQGLPEDSRAKVAARKVAHEVCARMRLPYWWTGPPEASESRETPNGPITGIGAYGGVVEGTADVVDDPGEADIGPEEILVCYSTDPAWTPLFMSAAAVVIDIGGELSHGVIAARELGVTCVVGTGTASRVLRTGDRIRVDGSTGVVEVLASVAEGTPSS
jgi:pyruvate,water dikinase